jgi:aldehyde dehydrogenase (NAD+)
MSHEMQHYVDGAWVDPLEGRPFDVIDPSTEEPFAQIALGGKRDVDRAVAAARRAFPEFSRTSKAERIALLQRIIAAYEPRIAELAAAVSREMGAPIKFARDLQAPIGIIHLRKMIETLEAFEFDTPKGTTMIAREPIGVCGMITPWNWPLNQIACKVGPALAAGCTMVLKPSEIAPLNAVIFAEIMDAAGVPKGVFNMVQGDGPTVGQAIAGHPDVDMVSFTGSTRAGIQVAKTAADTVKRVHQELGGKSANIILPDADFATAVGKGVMGTMRNSGQSCNAPTRMFVPADRHEEAVAIAKATAGPIRVGSPREETSTIGPVVSQAQYDKVQDLIQSGIAEGAELVTGGPGRPDGLNRGYYVRPTVFAQVRPEMRIAKEEIFGPVLSIMPYESEDQAIRLANDTPYGLAAYVQSADIERARRVARQLRAGAIQINYPAWDAGAPFGGYKQSGNGREYAEFGLAEFLEIKGMIGYGAP